MMETDDLVLREKVNKYEEIKRRIASISNKYRMISDKEIIEYLAEEIEQYRNRIESQRRIINELSKKTIQSEEVTSDTTNDELVDEDIVEITSTTQYADGRPIISKMEYKYKENDNKQEQNTCPPIEIGITKAY